MENNDWFNGYVQALFIFFCIVYRAMVNINVKINSKFISDHAKKSSEIPNTVSIGI